MKLYRFFRRKRRDQDCAEELAAHLLHEIDENLARGMSEEEARREARVKLGNVQRVREEIWQSNSFGWAERLLRGLRHATRRLMCAPGFALVAILTLAIGIGATTAIFTMVYDVLLRPLPYPHANRLVMLREAATEFEGLYPTLPLNAMHFDTWEQNNRSFTAMAALFPEVMPLGTGEHPEQESVLEATSGIFAVLGAKAEIGRVFTAQECQPGKGRVVVLMHRFWQTQFEADPHILGKQITLNGYPYTVVGVMPASFHLPDLLEALAGGVASKGEKELPIALLPLSFTPYRLADKTMDYNYLGFGLLKPGVSLAQAQAELDGIERSIIASLPANEKINFYAKLFSLQNYLTGDTRRPMLILLAAVIGLLLVGCINLMNLMLVRAMGRRQELALASALGARRWDLLWTSLEEAGVLAFVGGCAGLCVAVLLVPLLAHFLPASLNFRGGLHLDWAGVLFAVLLSGVALGLAGIAPMWISWKTEPRTVLAGNSRTASESRGGKRLRKGLVSVEVAVSVVLVLVSGLLITSLYRLLHVDRGFVANGIVTTTIKLPGTQYDQEQQIDSRILARLRALPGVENAAMASLLPLDGDSWGDTAVLPQDLNGSWQTLPSEHWRWVTPGYFKILRLPLVAGRFIEPEDRGRKVAVVSAKTAKILWPEQNPIGQKFYHVGEKEPFTVIGVVGNARTISLASADPPLVFVPDWYRIDSSAGVLIRTQQNPTGMATEIRNAIWSVDPSVTISMLSTMDALVANAVAVRRFEMDLLFLFALSAWLLAGLGTYGVVAYSVAQRRQEVGVRMALGAQRAQIYVQIVREGMAPVVYGAVVGVLVAFALGRLLMSLLFHTSPFNPWVAIFAVLSLCGMGVLACLLPARQAAMLNPMQMLRAE